MLKFSVKNTEHGAAEGGEQPQPGIYEAEILAIDHRTGRGQGKEDDLKVTYKIINSEKKYALLYDYVGLENETTEWKRAQFLEAIGVATPDKREGEFDPKKHTPKFNGEATSKTGGTKVKLRVKSDSYQGEYKGKIAAVLPHSPAGEAEEKSDDPFA